MPDEKPVYSGIENNSVLTIGPNYFNLFGRVLLLILVSALLFLLHKLIEVNGRKAIIALYFLFLLYALVIVLVTKSFFGIVQVQIDKAAGILTFNGILTKKVVLKSEISGYCNTFSISRRKTFYGLLLHLSTGDYTEVNEYNLKSINEIEEYLQTLNIESAGKLRLRFPFGVKQGDFKKTFL